MSLSITPLLSAYISMGLMEGVYQSLASFMFECWADRKDYASIHQSLTWQFQILFYTDKPLFYI